MSALLKSSLKSFKKGNFARSTTKSLLDSTYDVVARSLVVLEWDDSSTMMSRASLIVDGSSFEFRADGRPFYEIKFVLA